MRFPNFSGAAMKFGEALEKARKFKISNIILDKKPNSDGFTMSVYRGGTYCGPGWGFTRQDLEAKNLTELPQALDAIDLACQAHDQGYKDNGYWDIASDKKLISDLRVVVRTPTASFQQRFDAVVISSYFVVQSNVTIRVSETKKLYQSIQAMFMLGQFTMQQVIEHHIKKYREK